MTKDLRTRLGDLRGDSSYDQVESVILEVIDGREGYFPFFSVREKTYGQTYGDIESYPAICTRLTEIEYREQVGAYLLQILESLKEQESKSESLNAEIEAAESLTVPPTLKAKLESTIRENFWALGRIRNNIENLAEEVKWAESVLAEPL